MNDTFKNLTFMFPMWNEEEMILRTVAAARETGEELIFSGQIADYEILIVDDASTDSSGVIADELAANNRSIRVIHHEVNRKLGGTMRTGFAEARGDVVLYTDADMPFDLADLGKALRLMHVYDADIVAAYRFDRTAEGSKRTLYSYVYNSLVRFAFGLRIRDVNFAFKVVRRNVLEHVELQSEGSFIDAELLAKAQRMGFHIVQFGVDYFPRYRGTSTLSSATVIKTIVKELSTLLPSIRRVERLPDRALRHR
jgi:glycosyltransferase involved in cell wall biosynthesis